MPEGIEGTGPISPQDRVVYKEDFAKCANLFQQSLEEYDKASEVHKKEKFLQVMDEALLVMNETAVHCLSKRGQKLEKLLDQDYRQFVNETTPENREKLTNDISQIQKLI